MTDSSLPEKEPEAKKGVDDHQSSAQEEERPELSEEKRHHHHHKHGHKRKHHHSSKHGKHLHHEPQQNATQKAESDKKSSNIEGFIEDEDDEEDIDPIAEGEEEEEEFKHFSDGGDAQGEIQPEDDILAQEPNDETISDDERRKLKHGKKRAKLSSSRAEKDMQQRELISQQVKTLTEEMQAAIETDIANKKAGKPTFEKLKLLPKVQAELKKEHLHSAFLEANGCLYLERYIARHADGTYPCINILETVLDILDSLPITEDSLLNNHVGKVIKDLYQTSESISIKMKANKLIDKWCRKITNKETDYSKMTEKDENYVHYLKSIANAKKRAAQIAANNPENREEEKGASLEESGAQGVNSPTAAKEVSSPGRTGFHFVNRPPSEIIKLEKKKKGSENGLNELTRKIRQVKRESRPKVPGTNKPKGFL